MVRFTKRYKYSRMNGGKKKRRKTKKNKRRKHRKGGRIGPFGKQLPYSTTNPPKKGDVVRINGETGWTVTRPQNRSAWVCRTKKAKDSEFGYVCDGEEKEVLYTNMTKRGSKGRAAAFLGLSGGRRKKKGKKTRKKSKRKRRKTKRRMKGGSGKGLLASPACSGFNCDLPTDIGKVYTHYPNNTNPFFPDPMSLNRNTRNPISPKPMGGKKGGRKKRRKGRKNMKGGFFWDDWGLGDGLLAYYKGTNAALNTKHLYAGNKSEVSATPTHQPALLKSPKATYSTANVPDMYQAGSMTAADYTPKN